MAKRKEIRNSTAEFLIFQIEGKEQGVEVYYKDKTIWCTQKAMSVLFDCSTDNVSVHLRNIYETAELKKEATTEIFSVVRLEGNRNVNRTLQFYARIRNNKIQTKNQSVFNKRKTKSRLSFDKRQSKKDYYSY